MNSGIIDLQFFIYQGIIKQNIIHETDFKVGISQLNSKAAGICVNLINNVIVCN